jgi:hypothetical protein
MSRRKASRSQAPAWERPACEAPPLLCPAVGFRLSSGWKTGNVVARRSLKGSACPGASLGTSCYATGGTKLRLESMYQIDKRVVCAVNKIGSLKT